MPPLHQHTKGAIALVINEENHDVEFDTARSKAPTNTDHVSLWCVIVLASICSVVLYCLVYLYYDRRQRRPAWKTTAAHKQNNTHNHASRPDQLPTDVADTRKDWLSRLGMSVRTEHVELPPWRPIIYSGKISSTMNNDLINGHVPLEAEAKDDPIASKNRSLLKGKITDEIL